MQELFVSGHYPEPTSVLIRRRTQRIKECGFQLAASITYLLSTLFRNIDFLEEGAFIRDFDQRFLSKRSVPPVFSGRFSPFRRSERLLAIGPSGNRRWNPLSVSLQRCPLIAHIAFHDRVMGDRGCSGRFATLCSVIRTTLVFWYLNSQRFQSLPDRAGRTIFPSVIGAV